MSVETNTNILQTCSSLLTFNARVWNAVHHMSCHTWTRRWHTCCYCWEISIWGCCMFFPLSILGQILTPVLSGDFILVHNSAPPTLTPPPSPPLPSPPFPVFWKEKFHQTTVVHTFTIPSFSCWIFYLFLIFSLLDIRTSSVISSEQ
jgi:hypothetical protein